MSFKGLVSRNWYLFKVVVNLIVVVKDGCQQKLVTVNCGCQCQMWLSAEIGSHQRRFSAQIGNCQMWLSAEIDNCHRWLSAEIGFVKGGCQQK